MSCPPPFLAEVTFPDTGGILSGRFCMPVALLGNASCCLPCPVTQWTYDDGFDKRTEVANWVNLAAFILSLYLIVSFVVLPVKYTHRHYLSVCLTLGVVFMELAFIVPLAAKPEQCFNEITPNDMRSSGACAISGAFLLFGGWAVVIWVFMRALALHLQICWEVVTGNTFFYCALAFGWLIPAVGLTLTLSLTGVSFRFGNVCHINHNNALQDFWGPLLAFAALALVLQAITVGYCIHVYIRSLFDDRTTTNSSAQGPSYSGSVRTVSARQAYRRVRRVIQLQWRGAAIVLVIIGEVVFFSVVFVSMDNSTQVNQELLVKATPWITCLLTSGGDKNRCLPLANGLVQPEAVVLAVLIILGLSGFWLFIFLGRLSMMTGWRELMSRRFSKKNEFVSADARRLSTDPRTYEMLSGHLTPAPNDGSGLIKSPDRVLSPTGRERGVMPYDHKSPLSPLSANPFTAIDMDSKNDYYNSVKHSTSVRSYNTPVSSYSHPHPPGRSVAWDHRSSHAQPANDIGKAYSTGDYNYR